MGCRAFLKLRSTPPRPNRVRNRPQKFLSAVRLRFIRPRAVSPFQGSLSGTGQVAWLRPGIVALPRAAGAVGRDGIADGAQAEQINLVTCKAGDGGRDIGGITAVGLTLHGFFPSGLRPTSMKQ